MKSIVILAIILASQLAMLVHLKQIVKDVSIIRTDLDEVQQRECVQIVVNSVEPTLKPPKRGVEWL